MKRELQIHVINDISKLVKDKGLADRCILDYKLFDEIPPELEGNWSKTGSCVGVPELGIKKHLYVLIKNIFSPKTSN